ncbi:MAG TPA: hypothetical protein ENF72_00570 [Thermococcus litoralis]|uniref:Uncharacterized protein n=1 Tax=Thermococcus litoralis TaxID=2265 RepID=A0A7C0TYH7_THELI|nr:hypothetical protein [Thermococcus litoralis]
MIVIWKSEFAGDADCRGGAIFADYSKNLYIVNNSFIPHSYLFSNIYGVHLVMVENSLVYGNRFVSSIKYYPSAAKDFWAITGSHIVDWMKMETVS